MAISRQLLRPQRFGDTASDTLHALHRAADLELADDGGIAPLHVASFTREPVGRLYYAQPVERVAQVVFSSTPMTPEERRWHEAHPVTLTMCELPSDPETIRALIELGHAAGMAMATEEQEETMNQELEDEHTWPHRCGLACAHAVRTLEQQAADSDARYRRIAIRLVVVIATGLIVWALAGWAI
jgi:hypothetical protein